VAARRSGTGIGRPPFYLLESLCPVRSRQGPAILDGSPVLFDLLLATARVPLARPATPTTIAAAWVTLGNADNFLFNVKHDIRTPDDRRSGRA
jgi:hypothetical protein